MGLSLFDGEVLVATKRAMVLPMQVEIDEEEDEDTPKRLQFKSPVLPSLESLTTLKTKSLF